MVAGFSRLGAHCLNSPRRVASLFTAGPAGFLDRFFNGFTGFARAFLDPADQFFLFAFGELEIVIRELRPFLFQFALGDVPVAFDFECSHDDYFCFGCWFAFAVNKTAKVRGRNELLVASWIGKTGPMVSVTTAL